MKISNATLRRRNLFQWNIAFGIGLSREKTTDIITFDIWMKLFNKTKNIFKKVEWVKKHKKKKC